MEHHDRRGTRSSRRFEPQSGAPVDAPHPVRIHCGGCVLLILLLIAGGCKAAPGRQDVVVATVTSSDDRAGPMVTEPAKRISYGTEVFREPINGFVVVEEQAEVSGMHLPTRWIHLSFDTPDRRVNVTLTHDGAKLYVDAVSPLCSSAVHPLHYEGSEDESGLYAAMAAALEAIVDSCGVRLEGAGQYPELLERAEPGFPAAVRVMKTRVVQAFGRRALQISGSD